MLITMETKESSKKPADKARAAAEHTIEEIKVASGQVVDRVRGLIEEGNVRRIRVVKDERTLLEVPLTVAAGAGAAVVLLNPVLAALGALAALLTDVTLVVERDKAGSDSKSTAPKKDLPGSEKSAEPPTTL
jgi:hypothetical protein